MGQKIIVNGEDVTNKLVHIGEDVYRATLSDMSIFSITLGDTRKRILKGGFEGKLIDYKVVKEPLTDEELIKLTSLK
jgi:uncharacterized membrane protein